jgi:hypothetical protein
MTDDIRSDIERGFLIQGVDNTRPTTAGTDGRPTDRLRIPAWFRTEFDTAFATLRGFVSACSIADGDAAGARSACRTALDTCEALLRDSYNWVVAISSFEASAAARADVFATLGFPGGELGRFDDERILQLARHIATLSSALFVPAPSSSSTPSSRSTSSGLLPNAIRSRLTEAPSTYDAASALATGGGFQVLIDNRDAAAERFHLLVMQVRFHYCANTSLLDQTPELARIGFQLRRDAGDARPAPAPAAAALAVWNGPACTLSVPALPEHATSLSAFVEVPVGTPVLILDEESAKSVMA